MSKHVRTKKMMTKHIKKVVVCKGVLLKATAPIKESFYQQTRGLLLLELERSSVVEGQLDGLLCAIPKMRRNCVHCLARLTENG